MFNFKAIFYNILKFILGFTVFITIFTIANFVFYKFLGLTMSTFDIILSNIASLFFIYLIIYLTLKVALYLYDSYYIKKLNNILSNIKGGESIDEKR